ncbi:MAG: Hpt domain-containing protein, partial [Terracidiphilus sp.]
MDELTREFLIESQEGLDRMERRLTELEARPQDPELLADIFRSVHTIKGTTGFLGFKRLETLAHAGENLLGLLRDGKLTASRPIVTGLLELLDGLRAILRSIEEDGGEGGGDDAALIARLEELQAPVRAPSMPSARARAAARKPAVPAANESAVVTHQAARPTGAPPETAARAACATLSSAPAAAERQAEP